MKNFGIIYSIESIFNYQTNTREPACLASVLINCTNSCTSFRFEHPSRRHFPTSSFSCFFISFIIYTSSPLALENSSYDSIRSNWLDSRLKTLKQSAWRLSIRVAFGGGLSRSRSRLATILLTFLSVNFGELGAELSLLVHSALYEVLI
jgi:hypothetical protein